MPGGDLETVKIYFPDAGEGQAVRDQPQQDSQEGRGHGGGRCVPSARPGAELGLPAAW